MGMTAANFGRFLTKVDETLADLFPGTIEIGGEEYACSAVGGNAALEYLADGGGQAPTGSRYFRVSKAVLDTRPEAGTRVTWISSPATEELLDVIDCPDRPHETSWMLHCLPANR